MQNNNVDLEVVRIIETKENTSHVFLTGALFNMISQSLWAKHKNEVPQLSFTFRKLADKEYESTFVIKGITVVALSKDNRLNLFMNASQAEKCLVKASGIDFSKFNLIAPIVHVV